MTGHRDGLGGLARLGAAGLLAAMAAIGLAVFGFARGTWAVGGSDSSCYGLMADAFARGRLQPSTPLVSTAPWPDAAVTFAPGGFIPSPIHPNAAAPICAPGMSVLMAPLAALFGADAIFSLTPIAAATLVWCAFLIARRYAGGAAGVTAAILTATSPIVLYQSVQPMNDVVTAALWLLAIATIRRGAIAGVCVGVAILVRPNLAPLAALVAALPLVDADRDAAARWRQAMAVVIGAMPGVIGVLLLNRALYGGMLTTGYGSAAQLFGTQYVRENVANYGRAFAQTQYLVPALALLAPVVLDRAHRGASLLLLAFAGAVTAIYLLYRPLPEWWYLRFLIPALVVLIVLTSAVMVRLVSRMGMSGLVPIIAVLLGILGARVAGERQAYRLQQMEGRYRHSGEIVRDRLPRNAVVITEWESGSIRFHAGRDVVLWQSMDPAWLDRAIAWLRSQGLQPYLLFERGEERSFRDRFRGQSEVGALDWPPRFDINRQVRIYDPADRAGFLDGSSYATENIR